MDTSAQKMMSIVPLTPKLMATITAPAVAAAVIAAVALFVLRRALLLEVGFAEAPLLDDDVFPPSTSGRARVGSTSQVPGVASGHFGALKLGV